jgi:hypothetical protein
MSNIDKKYTEGVWYDTMNGNYCEIQQNHDLVELVNPENGNVYWDMTVADWKDGARSTLTKVPVGAVEDPVGYVNRGLRILNRNDIDELASLPYTFAIGLDWARGQVEITER